MHRSDNHPFAFPALFIGSSALAFGPWLVRLSGVGAVAAGFWRMALALPFLFAIAALTRQPVHWPGRRLALLMRDISACASDNQAAERPSGESRNWRW